MAFYFSKSVWEKFGRFILDKLFVKTSVYHFFNGKVRELKEAANYWKEPLEKKLLESLVEDNNLRGTSYKETTKKIMSWVFKEFNSTIYYLADKKETYNKPSETYNSFLNKRLRKSRMSTDCDDYGFFIGGLMRVAGVPKEYFRYCFMKTATEHHLNIMFLDDLNVPYVVEGTYLPEIAIKSFGVVPYMQVKYKGKNYYDYIRYLFDEDDSWRHAFFKEGMKGML